MTPDDIVSRLRTTSTTYVTPKPENAVGTELLRNLGPERVADLIEAARELTDDCGCAAQGADDGPLHEYRWRACPHEDALRSALAAIEEAGK